MGVINKLETDMHEREEELVEEPRALTLRKDIPVIFWFAAHISSKMIISALTSGSQGRELGDFQNQDSKWFQFLWKFNEIA